MGGVLAWVVRRYMCRPRPEASSSIRSYTSAPEFIAGGDRRCASFGSQVTTMTGVCRAFIHLISLGRAGESAPTAPAGSRLRSGWQISYRSPVTCDPIDRDVCLPVCSPGRQIRVGACPSMFSRRVVRVHLDALEDFIPARRAGKIDRGFSCFLCVDSAGSRLLLYNLRYGRVQENLTSSALFFCIPFLF